MTAGLAVALTAASILPGWWQVRTLVRGTMAAVVAMRCARDRDVVALLPEAVTTGCRPRPGSGGYELECARGGRLSVTGSADGDRLDLVARRSGPLAAHPAAAAHLHVEGRRVAAACPGIGATATTR